MDTKVKVKKQVITDRYAIYNGDCVKVLQGMEEGTVGLSIFSPPFADLYSYSDSLEDMGNCKDYQDFFSHFGFVIRELYRTSLPGRISAVHCMDLPLHKRNGDEIGIRDFPGDVIRAYKKAGWVYHSRICIWKDPLVAATRTKAIGLAHKQIVKDSSMCRTGIADTLLAFRKPGDNPKPVSHPIGLKSYCGSRPVPHNLDGYIDYGESGTYDSRLDKRSHWIWQQYASPVWFDIRQTKVLPFKEGKNKDDQRHICLAKGSLVLTKQDGYKPIQDVNIGDLVLTHLGRWQPVTAKRCNGKRRIIRVTAQGVPDLRLTPDHKIWTRYVGSVSHPREKARKVKPTWMAAEEIKASYVNLKLPPIEPITYSKDDCWLMGRWLADGHLDCRGGVHISCGRHKLDHLIRMLGERAGFIHDTGTSLQIRVKDPDGKIRDMLSHCGKGAAGKKVPGFAFTMAPEFAESLLSGYLSGDGHYIKQHDRWSSSSVSKNLLLGLAMITQRARGVVASVYAGRKGGPGIIEGREVNCQDDWIFLASPRNKSGLLLDDGAWKKVRGVSDHGKEEVWDIQVDEDSSFTAEGCIVHNCPLQTDVVERCLVLWSNPGDIVLTPFMGVGTEVYVSVKNGRKGVGVELKESYFRQAVSNMKSVDQAMDDEGELF